MIFGMGDPNGFLSDAQIYTLCNEALNNINIDNKRILIVIPDHTRTAPIDLMFRVLYRILSNRVELLDFIVALGTHPPMPQSAILKRVGLNEQQWQESFSKARFFNHNWKDPQQLRHIGTISETDIEEISEGLMSELVKITINKMVFNYDLILILGPTFPHEVVGFSGGNKYLFPGIAGEEIIDMFHWLAALITNPVIIGTKYTPVRKVVDKAADLLPMERMCISLVVKDNGLAGMYVGTPEEAWDAAADLSDKIHITYKERSFSRVLSRSPEMYDDIWTAGKCMYKLEPVVADGGELIIYAPHITEVSVSHGEIIEKIGYHVRDYFRMQKDRFVDIPRSVMAHSTHVKGIGEFKNGQEYPRVNVVLATQIPPSMCQKINLGYCDPASIRLEEWQNREDQGILYVPKAGEMLYRLKKE